METARYYSNQYLNNHWQLPEKTENKGRLPHKQLFSAVEWMLKSPIGNRLDGRGSAELQKMSRKEMAARTVTFVALLYFATLITLATLSIALATRTFYRGRALEGYVTFPSAAANPPAGGFDSWATRRRVSGGGGDKTNEVGAAGGGGIKGDEIRKIDFWLADDYELAPTSLKKRAAEGQAASVILEVNGNQLLLGGKDHKQFFPSHLKASDFDRAITNDEINEWSETLAMDLRAFINPNAFVQVQGRQPRAKSLPQDGIDKPDVCLFDDALKHLDVQLVLNKVPDFSKEQAEKLAAAMQSDEFPFNFSWNMPTEDTTPEVFSEVLFIAFAKAATIELTVDKEFSSSDEKTVKGYINTALTSALGGDDKGEPLYSFRAVNLLNSCAAEMFKGEHGQKNLKRAARYIVEKLFQERDSSDLLRLFTFCSQGCDRSPTVILTALLYLAKAISDEDYTKTLNFLRSKRSNVNEDLELSRELKEDGELTDFHKWYVQTARMAAKEMITEDNAGAE